MVDQKFTILSLGGDVRDLPTHASTLHSGGTVCAKRRIEAAQSMFEPTVTMTGQSEGIDVMSG